MADQKQYATVLKNRLVTYSFDSFRSKNTLSVCTHKNIKSHSNLETADVKQNLIISYMFMYRTQQSTSKTELSYLQ